MTTFVQIGIMTLRAMVWIYSLYIEYYGMETLSYYRELERIRKEEEKKEKRILDKR